ncbi:MAG: hypothetical protein KY476_09515 [Planctomycetes bacterium]|nr:hypothetical protein [Planctomycetota bacterium]
MTVDFTTREVVRYRPSETLLYGTPPLERAAQPDADINALKAAVFGTFLEVEQPAVSTADALTAELAHFIDCVRTGATPRVDGHAAVRALGAAESVLASVAAHRWDARAEGAVGAFPVLAARRRKAG